MAALLVFVISLFWFYKTASSGNAQIDQAVHYAWFSLISRLFLLPVWLVLVIVSYIIKEAFYGYKRRLQNTVMLSAVILTNAYLLLALKIIFAFFTGKCGVTIYPPLSAIPSESLPVASCSGVDRLSILFYVQIFFLLLLVIIAVLTGKNWNTKQRES